MDIVGKYDKTRTALKIEDVAGNMDRFKAKVGVIVRAASPRSWYTVLIVKGRPRALMLSRSGILPQATTRDAVYVDARRWLEDNTDQPAQAA